MADNMADTLTTTLAKSARSRVFAQLQVIAATPCPVHGGLCGCDAAMGMLAPTDHIWNKRIWYSMCFERFILDKPHAYNYNGTLASHDAFIAGEDMTPKNFIRKFINSDMCKLLFVHTGTLTDIVEATHDLWLIRHKQWRERYTTREKAAERWAKDEYPDGPKMHAIPNSAIDGPVNVKVGDMVEVAEQIPCAIRMMGRGAHRSQVIFFIPGRYDHEGLTPFGVAVREIKCCHKNCWVGKKFFEEELPDVAKGVLAELQPRQKERRFA